MARAAALLSAMTLCWTLALAADPPAGPRGPTDSPATAPRDTPATTPSDTPATTPSGSTQPTTRAAAAVAPPADA